MTPAAPAKPCRVPTCPRLNCAEHARESSRWHVRRTPITRDRSRRAQAENRAILARDRFCYVCHKSPSTEVDHVIPLSQGGRDVASNKRGICASCHKRKTARENQESRRS